MTSKLLDLDLVHPRGWGDHGETGDACEYGHQLTETDIKNLKKYCGLEISHHTINNNKYKLISLLHRDATDTVVSILGGDGRYYIIDSNNIPNGLIMPFSEYCKIKKLNLVIIDPDRPLEHAWQTKMNTLKIDDDKVWFREPAIRAKFKKWLKMARLFYVKNYNNLTENFFSQNKILYDIHIFIKDLEIILEHIKNSTNTNLWLMGHCSSAVMISIVYDINKYNHLYKGIIFLNPWWKLRWREIGLENMKYFLTVMTKPLLIIQHAEDPCAGTHPEISKKILSNINSILTKYTELSGGIDQGCPHFSVGYHGFRGIEDKVVDEINNFIQDYGKI